MTKHKDIEKYPTSKGWVAVDDKVETDGETMRLKPSYKNSEEFKDKLDAHVEKMTNPFNGRRPL